MSEAKCLARLTASFQRNQNAFLKIIYSAYTYPAMTHRCCCSSCPYTSLDFIQSFISSNVFVPCAHSITKSNFSSSVAMMSNIPSLSNRRIRI